jgi:N-acetylneuraminic acid mutarotase
MEAENLTDLTPEELEGVAGGFGEGYTFKIVCMNCGASKTYSLQEYAASSPLQHPCTVCGGTVMRV